MTASAAGRRLGTCLLAVAALGACSGSTSKDHASSTTGPRSTTTAPATNAGEADVSAACRRWAQSGSGPDNSAISTQHEQEQAAQQASVAAAANSRWQPLADAMTAATQLPLTDVSPAQQATSERDMGIIRPACAALGFPVP
jgi:hypothetical protein